MSRLCPVHGCNLGQFDTGSNGHILNFIVYFQSYVQTSVDSHGQKYSPFHGENRGSIPLGRASDFNGLATPNPKIQRLYRKYTQKCFCARLRTPLSVPVQTIGAARKKNALPERLTGDDHFIG